jgi:RNA polymerase sigma-70 factor (ECF subfamily)
VIVTSLNIGVSTDRYRRYNPSSGRGSLSVPVERAQEVERNKADALSYLNDTYRYAITLVRDPADAEDLVQEAYVRALNAIGRLRPDSNVKAWLFTIVKNIWRNQLRSKYNKYITTELNNDDSNHYLLGKPDGSLYSSFIECTDIQLVRDAINQLEPDHREIILLREYDELSYREIADVLNCPIGTVMSRLGRAREKLKCLLSMKRSSLNRSPAGSLYSSPFKLEEAQQTT